MPSSLLNVCMPSKNPPQLEQTFVPINWIYLKHMIVWIGLFWKKLWWSLDFIASGYGGSCCVSSVCFSIRFNGVLSDSFAPTRGLRQGDSLSPYLFLFVADSLSMTLQKEIDSSNLEELKITRAAPGISHLLLRMMPCYFSKRMSVKPGVLKR